MGAFRAENLGSSLVAGLSGLSPYPSSITTNTFGQVTAVGGNFTSSGITMTSALNGTFFSATAGFTTSSAVNTATLSASAGAFFTSAVTGTFFSATAGFTTSSAVNTATLSASAGAFFTSAVTGTFFSATAGFTTSSAVNTATLSASAGAFFTSAVTGTFFSASAGFTTTSAVDTATLSASAGAFFTSAVTGTAFSASAGYITTSSVRVGNVASALTTQGAFPLYYMSQAATTSAQHQMDSINSVAGTVGYLLSLKNVGVSIFDFATQTVGAKLSFNSQLGVEQGSLAVNSASELVFNAFPAFTPNPATITLGVAARPWGGTHLTKGHVSALFTQNIGANLASASAITPTNQIHNITGTAAIDTINVPAAWSGTSGGRINLIASSGVWSWNANGNIIIASTLVTSGCVYPFTWDPTIAKWFPDKLS